MELKLFLIDKTGKMISPFNRTTMELKPPRCAGGWSFSAAFNRTTMELKPCTALTMSKSPDNLLIEPLWNWNTRFPSPQRINEKLLIEPLWNWNSRDAIEARDALALLIEPLWNWNGEHHPLQWKRVLPFNRTTMELKLTHPLFAKKPRHPFNRTTMELKLVLMGFHHLGEVDF